MHRTQASVIGPRPDGASQRRLRGLAHPIRDGDVPRPRQRPEPPLGTQGEVLSSAWQPNVSSKPPNSSAKLRRTPNEHPSNTGYVPCGIGVT